jgi:hypothetical protein
MDMFQEACNQFLEEQKTGAHGQRLEMLNRDLSGTKKVLEVAVWPVLKTLTGLVLEYASIWRLDGAKVWESGR